MSAAVATAPPPSTALRLLEVRVLPEFCAFWPTRPPEPTLDEPRFTDERSDFRGVSPTMLLVQVLGGGVIGIPKCAKAMNKAFFGPLRVGRMTA